MQTHITWWVIRVQSIQSTYAGMVVLGATEEKVGSLLKVNSTPVPVTLALPMCTTTEPVKGSNELL